MTAALRHSCRYRRTKLSRCVVCEQSFRRKKERQRTCVDVRCKAELRRFPLAYSWPEKHGTANHPSDVGWPLETFDFSGSKQPIRPAYGCLREWCWTPEVDCELAATGGAYR
jgi:hypothetical protein